jgi:peptidyl-prolyl cis-trans isomerase C
MAIVFAKKITAAHILVDREFEAEDILKKLERGESFEQLAKDFSTCSSSSDGGLLGEFSRGIMVASFDKVAFQLEVGEISKIVRTQFGYHIIKRLA